MDRRVADEAKEAILWTTWRLQLTIPSVLAAGEEFGLRITALAPDGLPSENFDREIFFEGSAGIEGLPDSTRITPGSGGHVTVEGLRAVGPERAIVVARPKGCPGTVLSNPAWVFEKPPYRLYWGDIHIHTKYSNCSAWACKDPEFCYAHARDASHLDFAAAADHLRGIASDEERWPRLQELVREYDAPGRFVPFLAFESSHKSGHGGDINAYFLHADAPYFWLDRDDMRGVNPEVTLRQLWGFLDGTGKEYFTAPHHTARAGKYRSFADPVYDLDREPLFEIFSGWGSSESRWNRFPLYAGNSDRPCYFQDALRAGCRYGAIASSDDHTTMSGGESKRGSPLGPRALAGGIHRGLAAVRAEGLSREALWKAIKSRNCYATTFARTLLDVTIGELSMGQEAPVGKSDPLLKKRKVVVKVFARDPRGLRAVLVRNGEEMAAEPLGKDNYEVVFEDPEALDEIAIRGAQFHPEPFAVYYVRVESQFDQTQWSSPIWLDLA